MILLISLKTSAEEPADSNHKNEIERNEQYVDHSKIHSEISDSIYNAAKEEQSEHEATVHEEGHSEGGHGPNLAPLFFIIIALIIGTLTRHTMQKTPLPFTVLLVIFGLALGTLTRTGVLEKANLSFIANSIEWAGKFDPHLILFIFLPILIFEAAFAMDVHTFKKTSTNAILLAVPGIVVALFLTGAIVMLVRKAGIGFTDWTWPLALMFGAVISATDPVAVVALLKELGASKKLGTLIEGESMLNDGTAIVFFMVFFTTITGSVVDSSFIDQLLYFFKVSFGGILTGLLIGGILIAWVKRVFNDALIEITAIIVAAFLTFYVAEHYLHVSGVLGLVTLGLIMAGIGRTRISPEVEHFLHEFWELAAFIANTLIFIIVGVVIAQRIPLSQLTLKDFMLLGLIYLGIHIVRAVVILVHYPIMKKAGYGLPKKDTYVLWWGALRGAIGLALALIIAGEQSIPENIRNQILFLLAGTVTLTLLINATTIGWLVNKLGLNKLAPAKAMMIYHARQYLRQSSENTMEKLKSDRFIGKANWNTVMSYMPEEVSGEVDHLGKIEKIAETRRRILEKEKSSYWYLFKEGMINSTAVRQLSDTINEILDAGGTIPLSARKDLEELWKTPKMLNRLQNIPLFGKIIENYFFERLSVSYDTARGFVEAQEEGLKLVESMARSAVDKDEEKILAIIEEEINENRIHGLTFIRNLRKNYPEIYTAIATRQAIRTMLNYELKTVERLQKNGRIDTAEASKMTSVIEERMKRLMQKPPRIKLPDTLEILREIPWLHDLRKDTFDAVEEFFQQRVYSIGDTLIKEDTMGDSLYIIIRGNVKISKRDKVLDIQGPGTTIGEMAILTGKPFSATVSAESPVTALRLKYLKIQSLLANSPDLKNGLWKIAGVRIAEGLLADISPYNKWKPAKIRGFLNKGEIITAQYGKEFEISNKLGILLHGVITREDNKNIIAPSLLEEGKYRLHGEAVVIIC